MKEIKLYKSIGKGLKLIGLTSLFVIPSIYFIAANEPEMKTFSSVAICFFGWGYPIGLYKILDRRPHLVINEIGIFDRSLGDKTINWEVISDAYIAQVHGIEFICLSVDSSFELQEKTSKIKKMVAAANESLGFQEYNISLENVSVKSGALVTLILQMIHAEMPERRKLLELGQEITG